MKALVLTEYDHFTYTDVPTPTPGPDEVLIAIKACSVCGSDVHGMDGSTGRRRPPVIMGHEASGQIVEVGSQVSDYSPGDRVTFDSTVYCTRCEHCQAGNVNLCTDRQVLGVSCEDYNRDGAMAEYLVVPAAILYRMPEGVSYLQAAMVEPMAIAYHAATRATVSEGMSVLIVGVGTIGLLIQQVVKAMGAACVIAVDIEDAKLATAQENGADVIINSARQDALAAILEATDGAGVNVAFDATGLDATTDLCVRATALNGDVVLVGNLDAQVSIPLQWVVTRQISIHGSCASAGEYPECMDLIAQGKVDVEALVSAVVPLSQGNEWIHKVYRREEGLNKICVVPDAAWEGDARSCHCETPADPDTPAAPETV